MYVLQHADQPGLYANLPQDPQIDPLVSVWKGITKPLAIAAFAAVSLAGLFHYITKGPNEVSKETEKEVE
jgi:formate dehydrogenase iron-sulfur subunit